MDTCKHAWGWSRECGRCHRRSRQCKRCHTVKSAEDYAEELERKLAEREGMVQIPKEPNEATIDAIGRLLDEWNTQNWEHFAIAVYKVVADHLREGEK